VGLLAQEFRSAGSARSRRCRKRCTAFDDARFRVAFADLLPPAPGVSAGLSRLHGADGMGVLAQYGEAGAVSALHVPRVAVSAVGVVFLIAATIRAAPVRRSMRC
jgi:hypothetical protein